MRWIVIFSCVCAGVAALAYGVMWGLGAFSDFGPYGIIAAIFATLMTTALGVALMALTFYSNRSGHDLNVYHLDEDQSSSEDPQRK